MTDNEIIKALEYCTNLKVGCGLCPYDVLQAPDCNETMLKDVLDLIKRQQKKIDELTDRTAIRAIDRIHYNIAEMNLIKAGFDMEELKKRFRAEFEEKMELGIDDCINWADWLDSIASEIREEAKGGESDDR